MAQLFTNKHNRIVARIAQKEALLADLDTVLSSALQEGVKEYSFKSGPGEENVTNFSPASLRKQIAILESEIEHLYQKIEGTGVVKFKIRRNL